MLGQGNPTCAAPRHALGMAWQGHQAVPSTSAAVRHMGSLLPVPGADASPNQRDYDAQRLLPPWAGHEPTISFLGGKRFPAPRVSSTVDGHRGPGRTPAGLAETKTNLN